MKKYLFTLLLILLFSSCSKTFYEVSYVDMEYPADTLKTSITVTERTAFKGKDAKFNTVTRNFGTVKNPLYVRFLEINGFAFSKTVYSSYDIILITDIKNLDQNENNRNN